MEYHIYIQIYSSRKEYKITEEKRSALLTAAILNLDLTDTGSRFDILGKNYYLKVRQTPEVSLSTIRGPLKLVPIGDEPFIVRWVGAGKLRWAEGGDRVGIFWWSIGEVGGRK